MSKQPATQKDMELLTVGKARVYHGICGGSVHYEPDTYSPASSLYVCYGQHQQVCMTWRVNEVAFMSPHNLSLDFYTDSPGYKEPVYKLVLTTEGSNTFLKLVEVKDK